MNPLRLTGSAFRDAPTSRRPHSLRPERSSESALGTPGIRRFDWDLRPAAQIERRAGRRRAASLQLADAARLVLPQTYLGTIKMIWSIRPTGTSAQNWSPDLERDSRLDLEWIARGLTAKSFWTARRR